ncbi:unnamed protein product [Ectocarpus sp. CCAP 1310/34]|nr:unnamed protein product [Ectocarpus sp. CCAP 1310/34]
MFVDGGGVAFSTGVVAPKRCSGHRVHGERSTGRYACRRARICSFDASRRIPFGVRFGRI